MNDPDLRMPWQAIGKVTAAFGLLLTGVCAAVVRGERRRQVEDSRVRWTDKNRWE